MLIRRLQRVKGSLVVTVPRDVARAWERRQVHHVLFEIYPDRLELRPLPDEDLLHYPAPEEEPPLER